MPSCAVKWLAVASARPAILACQVAAGRAPSVHHSIAAPAAISALRRGTLRATGAPPVLVATTTRRAPAASRPAANPTAAGASA